MFCLRVGMLRGAARGTCTRARGRMQRIRPFETAYCIRTREVATPRLQFGFQNENVFKYIDETIKNKGFNDTTLYLKK